MTIDDVHYRNSSARENVLEHLFIGEILKTLWLGGVHDVEVLRSEVDDWGYDLVIECNGFIRHVQLKSTHHLGKASRQNINIKIATKPSGCVVWMIFNKNSLQLGPFRWLGGLPGQPIPSLGDKIARHTKGNSEGVKLERPNIRVINKRKFREVKSMTELVRELFGDTASATRKPS